MSRTVLFILRFYKQQQHNIGFIIIKIRYEKTKYSSHQEKLPEHQNASCLALFLMPLALQQMPLQREISISQNMFQKHFRRNQMQFICFCFLQRTIFRSIAHKKKFTKYDIIPKDNTDTFSHTCLNFFQRLSLSLDPISEFIGLQLELDK